MTVFAATALLLAAAVLWTVFLVRQGLDKADKWASVLAWYLAAAGGVAAAVTSLAHWTRRRRSPETGENTKGRFPGPFASASLAVPTADAPPRVRGREQLLRRLHRAAYRPTGKVQILTGLGGVGKSTLAVEVCRLADAERRRAWWISANDLPSLTEGLVSLAEELGAGPAHLAAIRSRSPRGWERLWELLNQARPGWLLVFDNVDDPRIQALLSKSGLAPMPGS